MNLRTWINGTASISRHESTYLQYEDDMVNLTGASDSALSFIEDAVGDIFFFIERCCRKVSIHRNFTPILMTTSQIWPTLKMKRRHKLTADEHIFLLGPYLYTLSRALTTWLATLVLMVPVIILSNISSSASVLVTIALSAGFFLTALLLFTKARTTEIFTAGARYGKTARSWGMCVGVDFH